MLKDGKTLKEISEMRNLTVQTVEGHIAKLFEGGYDVDTDNLGFSSDIYNKIVDIINSEDINGNISPLKPIKEKCGSNISYAHIKYAIAVYISKTSDIYFK